MDIGFVWDETKYQEVRQKHHLQFYEVVSAFDAPNGYEVPQGMKTDGCGWDKPFRDAS